MVIERTNNKIQIFEAIIKYIQNIMNIYSSYSQFFIYKDHRIIIRFCMT